jgi:hypothetical protein
MSIAVRGAVLLAWVVACLVLAQIPAIAPIHPPVVHCRSANG